MLARHKCRSKHTRRHWRGAIGSLTLEIRDNGLGMTGKHVEGFFGLGFAHGFCRVEATPGTFSEAPDHAESARPHMRPLRRPSPTISI